MSILSNLWPHRASQQPPPPQLYPLSLVSHELTSADVVSLQHLRVKRVRTTLYWNLWADPSNPHRQNLLDGVASLKAVGIRPLIVVEGEPLDVAAKDTNYRISSFASAIADFATQIPDVDWQLWNEADGTTFTDLFKADKQSTSGMIYGYATTKIYDLLKSASPSSTIVTTGVQLDPGAFLSGMLGAQAKFDAFAVHIYSQPLERQARNFLTTIRSLYQGPVWITETGVPTTSESDKANQLRALSQVPGFAQCFVYVHHAGATGFAVTNDDYSPRPAAGVIQASNL